MELVWSLTYWLPQHQCTSTFTIVLSHVNNGRLLQHPGTMTHPCIMSACGRLGAQFGFRRCLNSAPSGKCDTSTFFPPTTVCLKTGILWHLLICDSPLYIFFQSGSCQIIRFWIWLLKSSTLLVHKLHYSDSKQFKIRVKCHINKKLKTECRTTQWNNTMS